MTGRGTSVWSEKIRVRWGDMDALGHVNNVEYFRYLEHARFEWLSLFGIPALEDDLGPVAVRIACDFIKPIVYPETVKVITRVGRMGRSSVRLLHEIQRDGDPRTVFAKAEVVMAWIDHRRGKSVPLPESLRRALASGAAAVTSKQ